MSNFRTKLLGLAAVASAFAGVSYGQVVSACTSPSPAINVVVRGESQTELVSDPSVNACTNTVATTATVTLTMSAPATSKAFTPVAPATGNTEAALFVYAAAAPPSVPGTGAASGPYYGTISTTSPNVISFTGVVLPAGAFSIGISNVRVNAVSSTAVQVTATPAIIYSAGTVSSSVSGLSAENVAFVQPSLAAASLVPLAPPSPTTVTNFTVCGGNFIGGTAPALGSAAFVVSIKELFTGAFKAQLAENGSYVPGGGSAVGVASGPDQILITLGNVPSSATVYVPQTLTASGGTTLTLLNSTAVTTSPAGLSATPTTGPAAAQAPFVAFTPSNGGVTITYTVSGVSTGAGSFTVPTFISFAANVAAAQGPITILESYGPTGTVTGPAASVPTFAASTATPLSGSSITLCQTSLLFPFVTNQLGFDTGLVIANTSTDALGKAGASSVTAQTGTCTLSFFGATAPSPATGVADPQGALPTATSHAFLLSSVAPGFQGYVIATCPMLYIHGYGFLAYDLTQNNGAVEGYIAEVLTRGGAGDAVTF
jgi:hypothetical protein